jgi:hypothetical protein
MKEDFLVDIKPNDRFGLGGDERWNFKWRNTMFRHS